MSAVPATRRLAAFGDIAAPAPSASPHSSPALRSTSVSPVRASPVTGFRTPSSVSAPLWTSLPSPPAARAAGPVAVLSLRLSPPLAATCARRRAPCVRSSPSLHLHSYPLLPIVTPGSRATSPEPFHCMCGGHCRSSAARANRRQSRGLFVPVRPSLIRACTYALRRYGFTRHTAGCLALPSHALAALAFSRAVRDAIVGLGKFAPVWDQRISPCLLRHIPGSSRDQAADTIKVGVLHSLSGTATPAGCAATCPSSSRT